MVEHSTVTLTWKKDRILCYLKLQRRGSKACPRDRVTIHESAREQLMYDKQRGLARSETFAKLQNNRVPVVAWVLALGPSRQVPSGPEYEGWEGKESRYGLTNRSRGTDQPLKWVPSVLSSFLPSFVLWK